MREAANGHRRQVLKNEVAGRPVGARKIAAVRRWGAADIDRARHLARHDSACGNSGPRRLERGEPRARLVGRRALIAELADDALVRFLRVADAEPLVAASDLHQRLGRQRAIGCELTHDAFVQRDGLGELPVRTFSGERLLKQVVAALFRAEPVTRAREHGNDEDDGEQGAHV